VKGYLVDTNIPSELTRPKPDPRVTIFLKGVGRDQVYLSVLTLGEIGKGIAGLSDANRKNRLQSWLNTEMRLWFADRVLPVTETIAERWGLLAGLAKLRGTPVSVVDGLLAATALEHDLTVVTRNVRDFTGLDVNICNPWDER
jgi:predicted nucleic acid-binding protein